MSPLLMAARLAARDWLYERSLSLCAVLALASMLGPLLVLQGVKNGVVQTMRENLLHDPNVLVITPRGAAPQGGYSQEFLLKLQELEGARHVIARTRDIASELNIRTGAYSSLPLNMEPCAAGEPVLADNALPVPVDGPQPQVVLSAPAAQKLKVSTGETITALLSRRTPQGQLQAVELVLEVAGILPATASGRRMGFLPLDVMQDIQDYRDYIAVDKPAMHRVWTGRPRPAGPRLHASFRLYAADLDHVEGLARALLARGVESHTKSREIAAIRSLEQAIASVILIISLAVGAGFVAFTVSSVQGAVRRKDKMLGMLGLLGFQRLALLCYPLVQTLLTAVCGTLVAGLLYLSVAAGIDHIFADRLHGSTALLEAAQTVPSLTRLSLTEFLLAAAVVLGLSALAAMRASLQAASVEVSAAIREV